MTPVKSAPALFRLNGCGVGLYGSRDADELTGTFVATWCVSLLFVPCFCLRAYRVFKSQRGAWHFVGREPLSPVAKWWNVLLLAAILLTIGGVRYCDYTTSPSYIAKQQMASARHLVDQGHLAQAAGIYRALALGSSQQTRPATQALNALLDHQCAQAPLSESAAVYVAAAQVARQRHQLSPADVADKGVKLVAARGDGEPGGGVALLDAVRPLVIDTRAIDASRLALLQKWAAREPGNLAAITPLASLLAQKGQSADAKKLLLPVKDKLGDGEGARVLGTILGREGDYDGAYALLWPYVKTRLDKLHAVEAAWGHTTDALWDEQIDLLKKGIGPDDFFSRYRAAGKDRQHAMVQEYVNARIKNNPKYAAAQESLEQESSVVPVALDLGMVMLQRAQGQSSAATRKAQLESAEKIFLAIRGVAGNSDTYRLTLGEVYYWLGKSAEGHKLFEQYLDAHGGEVAAILQVGRKLRLLGAVPDARTAAEDAYLKAKNSDEQHQAASLRELCGKDLDDRIVWLNKADTADPYVMASLAKALGDKAVEEGRDAQAIHQYQVAIDVYKGMPRTSTTLNETALAYGAIFRLTGERSALEQCFDFFQQAADLDPTDSVLLYNAGSTLLNAALADVIGDRIDLRALRRTGDISLLGYLYKDQAGRDAIVKQVMEHPGVARALAYLDKVTILSPRDTRAFDDLFAIHSFTHNESALRALEQRVRAANPDTSDQWAYAKDYIAHKNDAADTVSLTADLKRAAELADRLRAKGGATAAVAIDRQVNDLLSLDAMTGTADLDKAVALAKEAHQLCPCTDTVSDLETAELMRAERRLCRSNPAFAAYCEQYVRSVGPVSLAGVVASEPGPFQQALLRDADTQAAIATLIEEDRQFTEGGALLDWALLLNANSPEAEALAAKIGAVSRHLISQSISAQLYPASGGQAISNYWLMKIHHKPADAQASLRDFAKHGIPLPIHDTGMQVN